MGRLTTISSYEKAIKVAKNQVTAQMLLNNRMYLKNGWAKIKLTPEFKETLINDLVSKIGGHAHTKEAIYNTFKNSTPQHWAIDRMIISKYGKNPARLTYCAGQDMTWEMRQLRNELK